MYSNMKSHFSHTKYSEEFICDKKFLGVHRPEIGGAFSVDAEKHRSLLSIISL